MTLGDKLLNLETDVYALFNYQFQVMPYNYLNLIASVTTLYLVAYSFHKGMTFTPDADIVQSLLFPLANVSILVLACVGLLMVGASLANPLGSDLVDFAVLTFLRSGAVRMHVHVHVHVRPCDCLSARSTICILCACARGVCARARVQYIHVCVVNARWQ